MHKKKIISHETIFAYKIVFNGFIYSQNSVPLMSKWDRFYEYPTCYGVTDNEYH